MFYVFQDLKTCGSEVHVLAFKTLSEAEEAAQTKGTISNRPFLVCELISCAQPQPAVLVPKR